MNQRRFEPLPIYNSPAEYTTIRISFEAPAHCWEVELQFLASYKASLLTDECTCFIGRNSTLQTWFWVLNKKKVKKFWSLVLKYELILSSVAVVNFSKCFLMLLLFWNAVNVFLFPFLSFYRILFIEKLCLLQSVDSNDLLTEFCLLFTNYEIF